MARPDSRQTAGLNAPAFLALGCIGFIASAPALAQDSQPAQGEKRLGGMTVSDTALDDEGYKVERVGSPKAVAPLLDTPRSIVVVDKQVIKETGSATLVEALRTVPGITFGAAEGGNPIGDRPFIRGFDSQGSTYLDGVRDIGAQNREIFAVEQLQIVRGSDSTLGGRGSAGGSLNIVSKLPQDENFVSGALNYGTDDYKRVTGDVNYKLSDTVGVRLNAMWHDQDVAGRDAIYQKRWGIAPSVTIGMGGPTRLTLAYYHLDTDELPDSGIPFLYMCSTSLCNAPLGSTVTTPALGDITTASGVTGHVDRDTFYGLKSRDFRDSKTDQATIRAEHDFGTVTLRHTARFSHTSQAYSFLLPDDSTGNVFGNPANLAAQPGGQVWRRANTRFGYTDSFINQTDLYGTFETGSIKHSFAVGGELSSEKALRGAYVLATGSTISPRCSALAIARYYCTSLFNPDPNDPWINYSSDTAAGVPTPITRAAASARTNNEANTKAVYAFDSITLTEQLILNLGARYDRFRTTSTLPLAAGVRPVVRRVDNIFNWQAGLIFKPTPNTSLYASYATAATPPNSLIGEGQEPNALNAVQAASDALRVEKTKSMEIGAKADLFGGGLSLTGAVFQTKTKNARVISDANTVAFIGERRIRGVELGFNGNITDEWNIFGGYTYLDAKIVDGGFSTLTAAAVGSQAAQTVLVPSVNTGKQFPQTAKHSFTLWTNYKVTPALSVGGGAFYSSRVYGGYADNRSATQTAAGVVTINPATRTLARAVPSYWRFDARIGYTVSENIDLSVNVQNLTDKTYFNQVYSSHYASIAPGRSAFATLSFKY
ncbi:MULTISPECIES: TonB-dependent receptor [unclassified Sphingomonas]|uniref:TonB-dependent receptor n=1 Tax=unclassified Sphingomonas TaxID=196159 RepID=UPI0006FC73E2|nr:MULTISPECIES: TonB-dependent siderophore receptor [unclassified Sphingomonas]KQX22848.1 TonB-dependent receptor [Sphingomonas sp. Root1294]KQY67954.1 TonB-dependent receptor [Sphingomonas sp. Root50]KRB88872.1 TonB-dependent receptor [Sphingomonas sp. Root720]